jgi:ribosomal protein S18 acetylase RimI-like enzyme
MLFQTITYLEMTAPPALLEPANAALSDVRLEPTARLSLAEYRALQRLVGAPWLWWERLALGDDALAAVVEDPRVEVRLLRTRGAVLGFCELDRRDPANIEIAFLGLVPEAIGRGVGRLLLAATLKAAWTGPARRVWLHTCDHDHPRALAFYQSAGFRVVRVETVEIQDPRLTGLLPEAAAPHVPLAQRAPAT